MSKKERECCNCGVSKMPLSFKRYEPICIECQDTGVEYEKECTECKETKLNTLFHTNRVCQECYKASHSKLKRDMKKQCIACQETKLGTQYRKNQEVCIACEDNKVPFEKECEECGLKQKNTMFRLNRKKCLDCERTDGRLYRRTTDKAKIWHENNIERAHELGKKHYEANKVEIRKKESKRYHDDPFTKKIKLYRISLAGFINGTQKSLAKIGMTRIQYMLWLNFCYTNGMTDQNHGELWHIDHVVPLNILKSLSISFDESGPVTFTQEEVECVFLWFNTSPVLAKDNLVKNKYLEKDAIALHIRNLKAYLKKNNELKKKIKTEYVTYKKIALTLLESSKTQKEIPKNNTLPK